MSINYGLRTKLEEFNSLYFSKSERARDKEQKQGVCERGKNWLVFNGLKDNYSWWTEAHEVGRELRDDRNSSYEGEERRIKCSCNVLLPQKPDL